MITPKVEPTSGNRCAAHMKTENNPNKVSEAIARMAGVRKSIKGGV